MSEPIRMRGEGVFHPHAYIYDWSAHLMDDVQHLQHGGRANYCRISSLLLVMSFEAFINYIGERHISEWKENRPWRKKLLGILEHFDIPNAIDQQPLSSLDSLFEYRNAFAHGKIAKNPIDYLDHGGGVVSGNYRGDPKWYSDFGELGQFEATKRIVESSMILLMKTAEPDEKLLPWELHGGGTSSNAG